MKLQNSSSKGELVARLIHLAIAAILLTISGWVLLFDTPFHPAASLFFLLFGLMPARVGLFATRGKVFRYLFLGYWF
ncbi:MAG: hypothetical protein K2X55_18750 [Burkholderiaceae bacterium]|nr:hypothetical protein [Burkholderiaceae bacterium]